MTPGASVDGFDDTGHMAPMEAPERVAPRCGHGCERRRTPIEERRTTNAGR